MGSLSGGLLKFDHVLGDGRGGASGGIRVLVEDHARHGERIFVGSNPVLSVAPQTAPCSSQARPALDPTVRNASAAVWSGGNFSVRVAGDLTLRWSPWLPQHP